MSGIYDASMKRVHRMAKELEQREAGGMRDMKIEWALQFVAFALDGHGQVVTPSVGTPVVRLPEVDVVIQEAVWAMEQAVSAMECGVSWQDLMNDVNYQRAQAFLASPDVAAWRKRQKGER